MSLSAELLPIVNAAPVIPGQVVTLSWMPEDVHVLGQ